MPFSSAERTIWAVFTPPTLNKVKGHIVFGFSIRPSVRYKFKIGLKNFIDAFLIKKTDPYFCYLDYLPLWSNASRLIGTILARAF